MKIGVRPLLGSAPLELDALARVVDRCAIVAEDTRIAFVVELFEALGDRATTAMTELSTALTDRIGEIRDAGQAQLAADALDCLEVGLRTHAKTIRYVLSVPLRQGDPSINPDRFYDAVRLGSLFDLCLTSVVVAIEGLAVADSPSVVDGLCVLIKDLAPMHNVAVRAAFSRSLSKVRPAVEAGGGLLDAWDRDHARRTSRSLYAIWSGDE